MSCGGGGGSSQLASSVRSTGRSLVKSLSKLQLSSPSPSPSPRVSRGGKRPQQHRKSSSSSWEAAVPLSTPPPPPLSPHARGLLSEVERRISIGQTDEWPRPLDAIPDEREWQLFPGFSQNPEDDCRKVIDGVVATKSLLVRVVTWNLQARTPSDAEEARKQLFLPDRHHIVVIGSEECERSIARSVVTQSKKNWEAMLQGALGDSFIPIRGHSLQATHLIVFARKEILPLISEARSVAVATGLGTTTTKLGNKGGIGISFKVGSTRFLFVNCHLGAGQNNVSERNMHFSSIESELGQLLGEEENDFLETRERRKKKLVDIFDRIVCSGDMNYRINAPRAVADILLRRNMHQVLLANDQLSLEMTREPNIFGEFVEGPLNFRPTYKFDKFSDDYDTSQKQRVPSWTDRILFHPRGLKLTAYNSASRLRSSDHRPVYASFVMDVDGAGEIALGRCNSLHGGYDSANNFGATTSEVCCVQ